MFYLFCDILLGKFSLLFITFRSFLLPPLLDLLSPLLDDLFLGLNFDSLTVLPDLLEILLVRLVLSRPLSIDLLFDLDPLFVNFERHVYFKIEVSLVLLLRSDLLFDFSLGQLFILLFVLLPLDFFLYFFISSTLADEPVTRTFSEMVLSFSDSLIVFSLSFNT